MGRTALHPQREPEHTRRRQRIFEPYPQASSPDERAINDLAADLPRLWDYGPVDAPIVYAALVRPLVALAEHDVEDARLFHAGVHERRIHDRRVNRAIVPQAGQVSRKVVDGAFVR